MYRVLIADDEPIELKVICKRIMKNFPEQVEIYSAQNGREAIDLFEEHQCQVAVLDIAMPGISGLEAAKVIRANHPDCSIIFLTAFDDFNFAKQAIGLKALDYLLKPGKDEELQAALEEAFSLIDSKSATPKVIERHPDLLLDERSEKIKLNVVAGEIAAFLEKHYTEDLSLQYVAAQMGYSEAYFCKLFKNCFDKTFIMYLNDLRTEKALELLGDMSISIKDISERVGYRDANYFTRIFKRNTGLTPSEARLKKEMS